MCSARFRCLGPLRHSFDRMKNNHHNLPLKINREMVLWKTYCAGIILLIGSIGPDWPKSVPGVALKEKDDDRCCNCRAARTPIGTFGGDLSSLSGADLGVIAIKEALSRAKVEASEVDDAILGQVLTSAAGMIPPVKPPSVLVSRRNERR